MRTDFFEEGTIFFRPRGEKNSGVPPRGRAPLSQCVSALFHIRQTWIVSYLAALWPVNTPYWTYLVSGLLIGLPESNYSMMTVVSKFCCRLSRKFHPKITSQPKISQHLGASCSCMKAPFGPKLGPCVGLLLAILALPSRKLFCWKFEIKQTPLQKIPWKATSLVTS